MKIRSVHFFKAGSYLCLLFPAFHITGHFLTRKPANETEKKLLYLMTFYEKKFAGGSMSMMNIVDGLNICYVLFFLYAGILNLLAVSKLHDNCSALRTLSGLNTILFFCGTVISFIYFFWMPVLIWASLTILFGLAWMRHRK
jgi:hypothetical protein